MTLAGACAAGCAKLCSRKVRSSERLGVWFCLRTPGLGRVLDCAGVTTSHLSHFYHSIALATLGYVAQLRPPRPHRALPWAAYFNPERPGVTRLRSAEAALRAALLRYTWETWAGRARCMRRLRAEVADAHHLAAMGFASFWAEPLG